MEIIPVIIGLIILYYILRVTYFLVIQLWIFLVWLYRGYSKLTLALVLKGEEANKIESQTLTQSDLQLLLKKSTYFLCASQPDISRIVNQLDNLEKKETIISEQQPILVRIHFKHRPRLQDRIFRRDDLHDFLSKGDSTNITMEKNALTKTGGLSKSGFIHT